MLKLSIYSKNKLVQGMTFKKIYIKIIFFPFYSTWKKLLYFILYIIQSNDNKNFFFLMNKFYRMS